MIILFWPLLLILLVVVRTVPGRTDLVLLLPTLVFVVAGVVVIRIAARDGRARDRRDRDKQALDRARDSRTRNGRARKGPAGKGSVTVRRPRRNGHRRSP